MQQIDVGEGVVRYVIEAGGNRLIVAEVHTHNHDDDEWYDWAAYSGEGTVEYVADRGDKLAGPVAAALFPLLADECYRP